MKKGSLWYYNLTIISKGFNSLINPDKLHKASKSSVSCPYAKKDAAALVDGVDSIDLDAQLNDATIASLRID